MPVNLKSKKRLVSRVTGVGLKRIHFDSEHLDDITDAITRDDIRSLLTANTIKIKSIKGASRGRGKIKKSQKLVYLIVIIPKPLKLILLRKTFQ